jgi:hypothetical protein
MRTHAADSTTTHAQNKHQRAAGFIPAV